jgi:hypothetical protein
MSEILNPEFLEKAIVNYASADQVNFLKLYHAACLETGCPKSDQLTRLISSIAVDPKAEAEVRYQALAIIQSLALQGLTVNPFSENPVAPTASSATSLRLGYKFGIEGNPYIRAEDIYMGLYAPIDAEGNSLGTTYHLFAAPQLQGTRTFNDTSAYLETLADGFKASNPVSYHKDLETAFANGSIEGKLFIPFLELLNGKNDHGQTAFPGRNLFSLQETGDFKGSYMLRASGNANWFLSSSSSSGSLTTVRFADFLDGHDDWRNMHLYHFSCRPCRVARVDHLTI